MAAVFSQSRRRKNRKPPPPAGSRRRVGEAGAPARETLQAAAPNKRKPAHGGGEPDKRQQAGQCVYIMLYYVNAFASRRAYVLPRQCSRAVGRGWFFRTGCAIEKRKRPVLIPPCTRSLVNTWTLIQAMDLQTVTIKIALKSRQGLGFGGLRRIMGIPWGFSRGAPFLSLTGAFKRVF